MSLYDITGQYVSADGDAQVDQCGAPRLPAGVLTHLAGFARPLAFVSPPVNTAKQCEANPADRARIFDMKGTELVLEEAEAASLPSLPTGVFTAVPWCPTPVVCVPTPQETTHVHMEPACQQRPLNLQVGSRVFVFGDAHGECLNVRHQQWTSLPVSRNPFRHANLHCAELGGLLYVAERCVNSNELQVFNSVYGSWSTCTLECTRSKSVCGMTALNGRLFLFGIIDKTPVLDSFDPITKTSVPVNFPLSSSACLAGLATIGPCLYLLRHGRLDCYDSRDDVWIQLPEPRKQCYGAACVAVDGCLIVIGGQSQSGPASAVRDVYRFDPKLCSWQTLPPLAVACASSAAVYVDGKVFVLGGSTKDGPCNLVQCFDPTEGQWKVVGDGMQLARARLCAAVGF